MNIPASLERPPRGACFLIDTPTGPINCRVDGNAAGPSIVFSNSHATDLSLWSTQVKALADRFNVVRYDQRGHGATPVSSHEVSFDGLAHDVVTVLDALGIQRAVLAGVSMGAVTMLRCAARYPRRVAAVLAADGQWAAPPSAGETWEARIRVATLEGMAALVEPTVGRWFTAESLARDAHGVAQARRMIGATSAGGYIAAARAMQHYDFRDDYPVLSMPVRYLVGENDGTLPFVMRQMSDATPDAGFVTITNTGHLPNLERPEAFNEILLNFLESVATQGERNR
jgi:3-oxoadipate enol-lactonase